MQIVNRKMTEQALLNAKCDDRFCPSKHKSEKEALRELERLWHVNDKGETNFATRLANGKGTRHCSTVLGSATTGKQDSTQTWTCASKNVNREKVITVLYLYKPINLLR